MSDLPTGTVTFLFTDIEGSTGLLHELGDEAYAAALAEHRRILRESIASHGGVEVDTEGDAFFVAFRDAAKAMSAARDAQEALAAGPIRVRMGIHTGTPHVTAQGYVGVDVHKGARIAASSHGGQIVISRETRLLLGEGLDLLDLGEHRVKDFVAPVWIYQLGKERFPPLKTISNTNLPRPASSFVGREREVGEVGTLLQAGARLVTLTGPGGTGKTRLAIEAAAELVPAFKNGVFWVPLADLRDAALVTETIAQTLGATDGLADYVGEREMLLLVDNLEQVIAVAPEIASLVETCRNLRLLVTSRELLRVRGETEYAVPPLSEPEAMALFSERARVPADAVVAELCRRLDALPLAIELAAARTNVLPPAAILERLGQRLDLLQGGRDAQARQATLRATIEWSHDLLSPDEQRLFAGLSVFRGGWTLEAAEAVAAADLDLIGSLVDKSLVRRTGERFAMLETVRQFAAERLDESGEADQLRRRHADRFLALAEEAGPHLRGTGSTEWLDRLDAEHDNLRATMDELAAIGESQLILRVTGALWPFWYIRGHPAEGERRLEAALRSDESPTPARAKALVGASGLAGVGGDTAKARQLGEEALRLNRRLGDAFGTAYSNFLLGHAAKDDRDWPEARRLFSESLRSFRGLGDDHYILLASDLLALAHYKLGDKARAWELVGDNLRRARATHNEEMEATELGALGFMAIEDGRVEEALPALAESTRIWHARGPGDFDEVGLNLSSFGRAAALAGRMDAAVQLVSAAVSLNEEIGAAQPVYTADLNEGTLALIREQLDEATFAALWEKGRKLTFDDAIKLALSEADAHG